MSEKWDHPLMESLKKTVYFSIFPIIYIIGMEKCPVFTACAWPHHPQGAFIIIIHKTIIMNAPWSSEGKKWVLCWKGGGGSVPNIFWTGKVKLIFWGLRQNFALGGKLPFGRSIISYPSPRFSQRRLCCLHENSNVYCIDCCIYMQTYLGESWSHEGSSTCHKISDEEKIF